MKKPDKMVLEAAKKSLDPKAALTVILNQPECEQLRKELIEKGLVKEIKE
jgi:hypothetical protein